jgi:chlorophyllide a reductase subunit Z
VLKRDLAWDPDAQQEFDRIIASHPILTRISAAKRLRDAVEVETLRVGRDQVVMETLTAVHAGHPV